MRILYEIIVFIINLIKKIFCLLMSSKIIDNKIVNGIIEEPFPWNKEKCLKSVANNFPDKMKKQIAKILHKVEDPEKGIRCFLRSHVRTNVIDSADAMSFNVIFAIVPTVIFIVAVLNFPHIKGIGDWVKGCLESQLQLTGNNEINGFIVVLKASIAKIKGLNDGARLFVKITCPIIALWGSSLAIRSIVGSFNLSYIEQQGWIKKVIRSLALTIVVYALVCVAIACILLTFNTYHNIYELVDNAWIRKLFSSNAAIIISLLIAVIFVFIAVGLLYIFGNKEMRKFKEIKPGLRFFMVTSIIATVGVYFLYSWFSKYMLYGFLGYFAIVLFWVEIICILLILGNEYNVFKNPKSETLSADLVRYEETLYSEVFKIFKKDDVISDGEKRTLDELRTQFRISKDRAKKLEDGNNQ